MGSFITKLAVSESKLRHDVRKEIVKNSGDTSWVTPRVIREYTAGQAADLNGSIDAFRSMSKSKETESLQDQLHEIQVPVRLLVGGVDAPERGERGRAGAAGGKDPGLLHGERSRCGAVRPGGTARQGAQGTGGAGSGDGMSGRKARKEESGAREAPDFVYSP